ncbi:thiamine diphosphokinase [Aliifodinibius sp. S!AR15-10]|uniref:thiamine diphosphokinase n=1 Tax=Aliifodinibius sp. S!AR15-10 TaxID=2950437 RepID=UPI002854D2E3|nr:thiamine diphosphokinase [Aliifodinibius sp. S!AR15-10]MDR8394161.1 thiamine diphosphokinase [Aliifodinibius sp. S!AR15-10]
MKGIILCNGLPPKAPLLRMHLEEAQLFIAADGGGNTARDLGHQPDLVIGDLDSFRPSQDDDFEVIKDTDQETNDLEKALELAAKRSVSHAVVLGVTGQRIDQTLKNLSVLKSFNDQFDTLVFEDNFGTMFLLPRSYSAELTEGTTVSLFPLSGRVEGIHTQGLKYPLRDESLENGIRDGSSNRVISSPIEITYRTGDLLIFVGRDETQDEF